MSSDKIIGSLLIVLIGNFTISIIFVSPVETLWINIGAVIYVLLITILGVIAICKD